jgi:hypothetical protein
LAEAALWRRNRIRARRRTLRRRQVRRNDGQVALLQKAERRGEVGWEGRASGGRRRLRRRDAEHLVGRRRPHRGARGGTSRGRRRGDRRASRRRRTSCRRTRRSGGRRCLRWSPRRARVGHEKRLPALRATHLEAGGRDATLIDLIRRLARVALDLQHPRKSLSQARSAAFMRRTGCGLPIRAAGCPVLTVRSRPWTVSSSLAPGNTTSKM